MRTPHNERLSSDIVEAPEGRSDSGPGKARPRDRAPERRCILTGETAPRDALIRLALSPDGALLPDVLAKAPGRGAWIGVDRAALEEAMTVKGGARFRGALARAFKGARVDVPDDLPQMIEDALTRAALDRLGLALRTGDLILGSERIAEAARGGAVHLLAHADDASEDGRRKLDQAWRVGRDMEGSGARGAVLPLDRAALSVALGRDNVVHLALADTRSARTAAAPLMRLLHYTGRLATLDETRPAPAATGNEEF